MRVRFEVEVSAFLVNLLGGNNTRHLLCMCVSKNTANYRAFVRGDVCEIMWMLWKKYFMSCQ